MTNTETTTYTLLGVNEDESTCSLCGRSGLKRVAWLAPLDEDGNIAGEAIAYGTDCAGKLLLGRKSKGNTDTITKQGRMMDQARRWLAAGHGADKVAQGIWNRYGYQVEARGNVVRIQFGGRMHEVSA